MHNFFIVISMFPQNPLSLKYANTAIDYSNSIAPQQWYFFTPVPSNAFRLEIRSRNQDEEFSMYRAPIQEAIKKHHRNLIGGAEKELYIQMELARSLGTAIDGKKDSVTGPLEELLEEKMYERLQKFIRYYAGNQDIAQWRLFKVVAVPFSKRKSQELLDEKLIYQSEEMLL
ncbi:MAG: hypothetical protein H6731_04890 [Myxococcales bacterium]|nr:MAG: hypothetical protein H6731_04890 [Myxococcales bacterium]